MTICIPGQKVQSTTLKGIGSPTYSNIPHFSFLPDVVTGYELYDYTRGDVTGFYLVRPLEANNLINNPTFYNDLRSWTSFNAKMVRTNEWAFDSGFSVRVSGSGDITTADRREYIQSEIVDFDVDSTYVFSAYVFLPQIWDYADDYSGTISIVDVDALNNEEEIYSSKIETRNKWIRLEVSKRIRSTATNVYVRLNLRSTAEHFLYSPYDLTGKFNRPEEYVYFDMLQFEDGTTPTTPFHGATQVCQDCGVGCDSTGYSWYGEPHNSPSHRSKCARDGGELISLSELGFKMLSHTGHGAPPVRDIAYPLANRPGEIYQKTAIDARILTFSGAICEGTLHDLECDIFGLDGLILPDSCACDGRFLLVYKHENCNNDLCDPERDLAICVTYIGGLEGMRDNLFQQRLTLQFKAHDPYWFLWPGHSSQALDFQKLVTSPNVVKVNEDGTVLNVPLSQGLTINTAACLGNGSLLIGGDFDRISESNCSSNLAILDCTTWCPTGTNDFASGQITTTTIDANGNVLIGGDFSGGVAIIYTDGSIGSFPNYPGSTPHALAAPFWGEIVVATDEGVYIETNDGNWYLHATDGPVYSVDVGPSGNIVAVGDFTTINGVTAIRIARYDIQNYDTPQWDAFDFGFDDVVRTVVVDQTDGTIYVGGDFQYTVPNSEDTCVVNEDTSQISSGGEQEVQITPKGGSVYNLDIRMTNVVAREILYNCFTSAPDIQFARIIASNGLGTTYNFVFGSPHATYISKGFYVNDNGTKLYTINFDIDTSFNLTLGSCETANSTFVAEVSDSNDFIVFLSPLPLPAGTGFDDTVSSVEINCITLTTSTSPDAEYVNHVAKIVGQSVTSLADGVDFIPTTMMLHPTSGELWVGGIVSGGEDDALEIYNGMSWREYGDLGIGQAVNVKDIKYCKDCSIVITYDGSSYVSLLPGQADINYYGNVAVWPKLVISGPASIKSIADGKNDLWSGCLTIECGESAVFDFNSGSVTSNYRNFLGRFGNAGSKMSQCLSPRCDNDWKVFLEDTGASTRATLIWRDQHSGIESLCCADKPQPPAVDFYIDCCPDVFYGTSCPTEDYCADNGYPVGSFYFDVGCICPTVYISVDDDCGDCCYYTDGCGDGMVDEDGNCLCPDDEATVTPCD